MADKTEFLQAIDDAILDADSLERFINGDDTQDVLTRLSKRYPTLQKAIKQMFENGGLPATPFKTKALMTASALVDGKYAMVTNDTDNNGLYVKTAGAWVKSEYDPLGQAKVDATAKDNAVLLKVNEKIEHTAPDNQAVLFPDTSGVVMWGFDTDGVVESPHPPVQGFGSDDIRSQLLSNDKLNAAGRYIDRESGKHLGKLALDIPVAFNLEFGRGHVRIASVCRVSKKRLFVGYTQYSEAGAEASPEMYFRFVDIDINNKTYQVSDRLSLDMLVTDGSLSLINPKGGSNAHFFETKDGFLMIAHIRNPDNISSIRTFKSTDNCVSWVSQGTYTPTLEQTDLPVDTLWMAAQSVCRIYDGIYKDRLVVAGFCWEFSSSSGYRLMSIYSDDEGKTWHRGYYIDPSVAFGWGKSINETSVTTDTDNNLIFICRDEANTANNKMLWAISRDGGKTLEEYDGAYAYAGACMSGLMQFAPKNNMGVPKILTTHPAFINRKGLALRVSYNNAKSWAVEYPVVDYTITAGYSQIARLDNHTIIVAYEYGGFNAYSNVSLKVINTQELYR